MVCSAPAPRPFPRRGGGPVLLFRESENQIKKFLLKQEISIGKRQPILCQNLVVSYYSAVEKKKNFFYILFIYLSDAEFHAESESVFPIS